MVIPFAPERRQILLPWLSQTVSPPARAVTARLPAAADPALLLHAVEHRIQRRESEAQSAVGLLLDAPSQLIAVKRPVLENAEHSQLGGASFDAGTNHSFPPYI